jgi:hypothetical protein
MAIAESRIKNSLNNYFKNNPHVIDLIYEYAAKDFMELKPESESFYSISEIITIKSLEMLPEIKRDVISSYHKWYPSYDIQIDEIIYEAILDRMWFVADKSISDTIKILTACFKRIASGAYSPIRDMVTGQKFLMKTPRGKSRCVYCGGTFYSIDMRPIAALLGNDPYSSNQNRRRRACFDCYERQLNQITYGSSAQHDIEIQDRIREYDQAISDCKLNRTCGVLTAHKMTLANDPERMRTSFLVGLTCGIEGMKKYLQVRGDFSPEQLSFMSDEDIIEYVENER